MPAWFAPGGILKDGTVRSDSLRVGVPVVFTENKFRVELGSDPKLAATRNSSEEAPKVIAGSTAKAGMSVPVFTF